MVAELNIWGLVGDLYCFSQYSQYAYTFCRFHRNDPEGGENTRKMQHLRTELHFVLLLGGKCDGYRSKSFSQIFTRDMLHFYRASQDLQLTHFSPNTRKSILLPLWLSLTIKHLHCYVYVFYSLLQNPNHC